MYGIDRQYPNGVNQSSVLNNTCYDDRQLGYGGICPVGYYCPGGTASIYPVPCDNGTYAAFEGMSSCSSCPEGENQKLKLKVVNYFVSIMSIQRVSTVLLS